MPGGAGSITDPEMTGVVLPLLWPPYAGGAGSWSILHLRRRGLHTALWHPWASAGPDPTRPDPSMFAKSGKTLTGTWLESGHGFFTSGLSLLTSYGRVSPGHIK